MSENQVAAVIIMAAGQGVRMKSARPKVLHEIAGHSMIDYAIHAANALSPGRLVVVVGHQRELLEAHLAQTEPHISIAVQQEMLGTGDAVRVGLNKLDGITGDVVVTSGDVPLLAGSTLIELVQTHQSSGNAITLLTATAPDPTGYGRIVRDGDLVSAIVEHRDATATQLAINEINAGIYVFDSEVLRSGLMSLSPDNAQGQFYLTDVIKYARSHSLRIGAKQVDFSQTAGVNDRIQLAAANAEINRRILEHWMHEGVTIIDPNTTWVHADVDIAPDVVLKPGTSLEGATSIAAGAVIGPDTTLIDVEVGEAAQVIRTHAELSVIESAATVGPFSYLRPGTQVGPGAKVGAFVEVKNAQLGAGAKVPHLTYCGDAVIGEGTNIGAGTIFANYDGVTKSVINVGAHSFIGSNSVLVAPVNIADGVYVASGSAITDDVGPGDLGIARSRQTNIPDWVDRRRRGSASQEAATKARQVRDNTDTQGQD